MPLTGSQLPLVSAVQAVHAEGGRRVRALLRLAIAENQLSHSALAHELGMDESHLSRALADDRGAHPSPAVYAALLALDEKRILLAGLAAMCGYEARPKTPDLEEECRRLRDTIARLRAALEGT